MRLKPIMQHYQEQSLMAIMKHLPSTSIKSSRFSNPLEQTKTSSSGCDSPTGYNKQQTIDNRQ